MERGGPPPGLRRRRRGAGGAPRQGLRAAAGDVGGLPRQGRGAAWQGGRGGHAGARGARHQAQGAAGNNGGLRAVPRARPPVPGIDEWWANAKHVNPKGLSLQEYERELDNFLTGHPRINQKELDLYRIDRALLNQGPDVALVLNKVNDGYRKIALTRKILLRMYLNGLYDTVEARHWRKNIYEQIDSLEAPLDQLTKGQKSHRGMPALFEDLPELLPKETKNPSQRRVKK